jgi:Mn2+/Fe2+ NRAMP family transporter
LKDYIHVVVDFTGGVCGVIIMMILPALMVLKARKQCPLDPKSNPYKSMFFNNVFAYLIAILGIVIIPYNLYLEVNGVVA